jgi:glycosyltransferase involved in cell wall biosynthesis
MEAYACEPDPESEAGIGWNWAAQAVRHGHEVLVITQTEHRDAITAEIEKRPIPGLSFHYLDLPEPLLGRKRRLGYFGLLLYHYLWQIGVAREARKLHRAVRFDIAHHVTRINDWAPSGLAALRIPFVWGPVGGSTEVWPDQIEQRLPSHARRHEAIKRWTMLIARALDPLREFTGRRASVILTCTEEALSGLKARERRRARPFVHMGVSTDASRSIARPPQESGELLIVTADRLVHWKGVDLLIEGLASFRDQERGRARLFVVGEGPYRTYLEELVRERALDESVEFLGHLPGRQAVIDLLVGCNLFALPTLRDLPLMGVLDAMAVGLPVLCLDHGATRELVPDEAGFKIAVRDREQVVLDIAEAIASAAGDLASLRERGMRAREHALAIHDWDRIGDEIDHLYKELVTRPRP